jgi:N4-gp56 family major capsid protein
MTSTVVPFGDVKAQKKWSADLAVDTRKKSYFERFVGTDTNSIIQRKTELEGDSGDRISFDLCVKLRNKPTEGDARLEGNEESLKFYTDEVYIDQLRKAVSAGGKMTRKRTAHDMRTIAKDRLGDYFAQIVDELFFMYLSGARGINQDFLYGSDFASFAQNPLQAPDSEHILFGGTATSKASLTASDKMSRTLIERAQNKARMMQSRNPQTANMVPVSIESSKRYVIVMNPDQEFDLRTNEGSGWLEVQRAAAAAEGKSNPIFQGGLGMIGNTVLHSHESVIRFSDYGAGNNVAAARALFMGRQAGVVAYGTSGGLKFDWKEETKDFGNEPTVASGSIFGIKKTRFNGMDFGVIALDTASKDPNA